MKARKKQAQDTSSGHKEENSHQKSVRTTYN